MNDSLTRVAATSGRPANAPVTTASTGYERWFAAYTNANHEKKVSHQLQRKMISHYLPVYRSVRRWKDRNVNLEMPLFPGYVFVRIALHDRSEVLRIPGVACLVSFNGMPAEIPANEIETLRASLNGGLRAKPHP